MKLNIYHRTEYHYENFVHHSIHELRLIPRNDAGQVISKWKIYAPSALTQSFDAFGNLCHQFVIDSNYKDMIIEAEGEVESSDAYEFKDSEDAVSPYYSLQSTSLTESSDEMLKFFQVGINNLNSPDDLLKLSKLIQEKIKYTPGSTKFSTTAIQSFNLGAGVCQDHAHIMLSLCRSNNIPARYVSGYFYETDIKNLASHAWVDVCTDPEAGIWLSVDITNACLTDSRHVRLATGRDYSSAAPIKGVRSGGGVEELQARVAITESIEI
jgi:transglutaminase-like putative cysteine protease